MHDPWPHGGTTNPVTEKKLLYLVLRQLENPKQSVILVRWSSPD
jgi:hypothetical protein